jgi:hypothetical protein
MTKEAGRIAYHAILAKLLARSRGRYSTVNDTQLATASISSFVRISLMLDTLAFGMINVEGK